MQIKVGGDPGKSNLVIALEMFWGMYLIARPV